MKDPTNSTSTDASRVGRGDFLKQLAAMIATTQFSGLGSQRSATAQLAVTSPSPSAVAAPDNLIGIQINCRTPRSCQVTQAHLRAVFELDRSRVTAHFIGACHKRDSFA